jgi:hypothetical protein
MTFTLLLAVVVAVFGQTSGPGDKSVCEQRAQNVMRSLEADNSLRHALENGQRGDCIHQSWMDTMRRFGIKQASFLVEYSWKRDKVTFRVKKISYLTHYYSQYDRAITGRTLREIKQSGLERELIEVVLAKVKKGPFTIHHADQVARDAWEENLLDDEALPAFGAIF